MLFSKYEYDVNILGISFTYLLDIFIRSITAITFIITQVIIRYTLTCLLTCEFIISTLHCFLLGTLKSKIIKSSICLCFVKPSCFNNNL